MGWLRARLIGINGDDHSGRSRFAEIESFRQVSAPHDLQDVVDEDGKAGHDNHPCYAQSRTGEAVQEVAPKQRADELASLINQLLGA